MREKQSADDPKQQDFQGGNGGAKELESSIGVAY